MAFYAYVIVHKQNPDAIIVGDSGRLYFFNTRDEAYAYLYKGSTTPDPENYTVKCYKCY